MSSDRNQPENPDGTALSIHTGMTLGKYPIVKRIAGGGMGDVWLARDPETNVLVAIKTVPLSALPSGEIVDEYARRLHREARTASKIESDHVVRVLDSGTDGDLHYVVMEYVEGGSLRELLEKEGGRLSVARALAIVIGVAKALEAATAHSIVHRDIKPGNIMFDLAGTPKLVDLGLAKHRGAVGTAGTSTSWTTATGIAMGTPSYMAPEQAEDASGVDVRADIYSLGVTFYEMATGELPFTGKTPVDIIKQHTFLPPPHPKAKNSGLPDAICEIILKMIAKAPAERYQTPGELLRDLHRALHGVALDAGEGGATLVGGPAVVLEPSEGSDRADSQAATLVRQPLRPYLLPISALLAVLVVLLALLQVLRKGERTRPAGADAVHSRPAAGRQRPTSGPVLGQAWALPDLGLELLPIEPETFRMGEDATGADEERPDGVTLSKPFWIAKTEVTQASFAAFVEASGFKTAAEQARWAYVVDSDTGKWNRKEGANWRNTASADRRPAVCLSWHDADAFCQWLTEREREAGRMLNSYVYRLPTEAEWEYCCRAGTDDQGAGGLDPTAWHSANSGGQLHKVATKQANAWGLHDMQGNVWEWCRDWYGPYPTVTAVDPMGPPEGAHRVLRGGGWGSPARDCRAAARLKLKPGAVVSVVGFRVVLAPGPP